VLASPAELCCNCGGLTAPFWLGLTALLQVPPCTPFEVYDPHLDAWFSAAPPLPGAGVSLSNHALVANQQEGLLITLGGCLTRCEIGCFLQDSFGHFIGPYALQHACVRAVHPYTWRRPAKHSQGQLFWPKMTALWCTCSCVRRTDALAASHQRGVAPCCAPPLLFPCCPPAAETSATASTGCMIRSPRVTSSGAPGVSTPAAARGQVPQPATAPVQWRQTPTPSCCSQHSTGRQYVALADF
jgi:hypothetical protein